MQTIEIDLSQDAIRLLEREVVARGQTVEWVFDTKESQEEILVRFIPYVEEYIEEDEE